MIYLVKEGNIILVNLETKTIANIGTVGLSTVKYLCTYSSSGGIYTVKHITAKSHTHYQVHSKPGIKGTTCIMKNIII